MKTQATLARLLLASLFAIALACAPAAPKDPNAKEDDAHGSAHKPDAKHDEKKADAHAHSTDKAADEHKADAKTEKKEDKESLPTPERKTKTPDRNPDPDANEFVMVEFEAQPKNLDAVHAAIKYPAELQKQGIKGTVYLKVLIDLDGYYKSHIVRNSPHAKLTEACVAQVKKLVCTPARNAGKPVKVWINFEHEFK